MAPDIPSGDRDRVHVRVGGRAHVDRAAPAAEDAVVGRLDERVRSFEPRFDGIVDVYPLDVAVGSAMR